MTKDQFIYALTACGCLLKDGKTWYEHNELIKCFEDLGLLEQEPTTKNDLGVDLISRNEILNRLASIAKVKAKSDAQKSLMGRCMFMVEHMPSVTLQPRKGHWIVQPSNKEQGERDFIWWKCSECGQVIFSETEHDRLEFHAFCGRCGADMREVEE